METVHPAIAAVATAAAGEPVGTSVEGAPVSRTAQARMLERIEQRGGAGGLLLAGRHLDVVASTPILLTLLNSASPAVLLTKIDRLNRYLHATHRHLVHDLTATGVDLEHRSTTATPPSPQESLFVCGLYLELLTHIGCRDVTCAFPNSSAPTAIAYRHGRAIDVPSEGTGRWIIHWSGTDPTRTLPGLDELLLRDLPPDLSTTSIVERVVSVIRTDLARTWTLTEVAAHLDMSPRTLQRQLRADQATFTRTVQSARVAAATELLRDPTRSVTDVGYLTGFADTAHFSRTFKRATGVTPSRWRQRAS